MPNVPQHEEVATAWIGVEELPVHFVNAFGVMPAPNALFLLFGSVMPLAGETEAGQAYAPVKPVARMAIAPPAVPQLVKALEQGLKQRDERLQTGE
jgi:hypothetical protein